MCTLDTHTHTLTAICLAKPFLLLGPPTSPKRGRVDTEGKPAMMYCSGKGVGEVVFFACFPSFFCRRASLRASFISRRACLMAAFFTFLASRIASLVLLSKVASATSTRRRKATITTKKEKKKERRRIGFLLLQEKEEAMAKILIA